MKYQPILSTLLFTIFSFVLFGQTQLEVQGKSTSTDTVAKIIVNYSGGSDVVGLKVYSQPNAGGWGTAGYFQGGNIGVFGESLGDGGYGVYGLNNNNGSGVYGISSNFPGVYGISTSGIGVKGESMTQAGVDGFSDNEVGIRAISNLNFGGYIKSNNEAKEDVVAGGSSGIFSSDPFDASSDLILNSYDSVVVKLDNDADGNAQFIIQDDMGITRFQVAEDGSATIFSNSDINFPQLLIKENENGDFARLRMQSTTNAEFWDIAAGGTNNEKLNFFRSSIGNLMALSTTGDPLVMSNGAKLTSGGVWTNASSIHKKTDIQPIDKEVLLEKVADLSIKQWRYKVEPDYVSHIGPMAQDFYASFGLGENDDSIGTVDADGVALAAIQALYEKVKRLEKDNRLLAQELSAIKELLEE